VPPAGATLLIVGTAPWWLTGDCFWFFHRLGIILTPALFYFLRCRVAPLPPTSILFSRRQPSAPPSNVNNPVPHDGRVDSGPGSKRARVDDRPASVCLPLAPDLFEWFHPFFVVVSLTRPQQAPPSRDQQSRHDSGRGHDAARGGDGRSRR
jgi:hypothetical protein